MEFTEKELVDLFWREHLWDSYPFKGYRGQGKFKESFKRPKTGKLLATREYALPSGKRCDLIVRNEKTFREFWVVEFKVEASVEAIIQLRQYFEEITAEVSKRTSIFSGSMSLAAQFFHPNTIYFAEALGIRCLHLAPINSKQMRIDEIVSPSYRKKLIVNNVRHRRTLEPAPHLGVVNG